MIKINSRSRFKILDNNKIEQLTKDNNLLLGKYPYFFNQAIGGAWCHNKDFGSKADHEFCSFNSISSQFKLDKGYLYIYCSGYGGMAWFNFNDSEINNMTGIDKECATYAIKYLKDLYKAGIIENPDK